MVWFGLLSDALTCVVGFGGGLWVLAGDFCVSLLCDLGLTSGCLLFVVYFVGVEVLCFSSSCLLVLLVSGYWIPGGVWF